MPDSIPKKILAALTTRLQLITIAGGYNTNGGLHVFRGRKSFDWENQAQFPAISVFDPEETTESGHEERNDNELLVHIEGHIWADVGNPADDAHDLLADVKKAVFVLSDKTLGGLASGMEYAGREIQFPDDAGSVVSFHLVLKIAYPELYGDPYTVLD